MAGFCLFAVNYNGGMCRGTLYTPVCYVFVGCFGFVGVLCFVCFVWLVFCVCCGGCLWCLGYVVGGYKSYKVTFVRFFLEI